MFDLCIVSIQIEPSDRPVSHIDPHHRTGHIKLPNAVAYAQIVQFRIEMIARHTIFSEKELSMAVKRDLWGRGVRPLHAI